MARLIIDGFETLEEALEYASWFEGQGEQDAFVWMDCNEFPNYYTKTYGDDGVDTVTLTVRK